MSGLVIVGGSYAGLNIAASARQHGYNESITLLTDEAHLPYHRPPLSKGYLTGAVDPETLPLKGERFYRDNAIEVVLGARAQAIEGDRVRSSQGAFGFSRLAIATGARARLPELPGSGLDGVVALRSLTDAAAIRERLTGAASVAIVGAGFIGLEVAASLAKSGVAVTVFESLPRVMARTVGTVVAEFVEARFAAEGVKLLCATGIAAIEGRGGRVRAVRDDRGVGHTADLVLIAAGATPNVELVEPYGLGGAQGVSVDVSGRTRDPRIFAAGDCAFGRNAFVARDLRLESVQNAVDQAKAAGAAIAGCDRANDTVPWFWSDQFDLKLQMVGLSAGADRAVVRGSPADGRFSVFHLRGERVIAIESVNAVSDHVLGRKLLNADHRADPRSIADSAFNLRDLFAAPVA